MSRTYKAKDPSRSIGNPTNFRRMSTPQLPTNFNYMDATPAVPRVLSPPPTPRSPPPRPDRLSLRLRSNSGLRMHTNDAALSQYTDYQSHGPPSPRKFNYADSIAEHSQHNIDHVLSPRSGRPTSRHGTVWNSTGLNSALPLLDLLGKDSFQMAMENQSIVRHLINYCEGQGCEAGVDFLTKVRQYNTALNEMTSVLTTISSTYTSIGASTSLNLPPMVSRPLNADIKRIAHSIIPSLESVFFESKNHVENEIAQDVFPGFVKRQLVYCAAADLASDGDALSIEFAGLGTSFCMTDASDSKNSIVMVSEDYEEVTGYAPEDAIGKNCAFLQGPFTDPEAIGRMQTAMRDGRECVELILNHHKNGEPFWNLLFLVPLKDSQGQLQYWLGAQVNVSECMDSRKELLKALNGGQPLSSESDSITGSIVPSEHSREAPKEARPRKNSLAHSRRGSKDLSSSRNWFSTFSRKQSIHCPPSPPPIAEGFDSDSTMSGSKKSKTSQYSSQRFTSKSQSPLYPTPYSCYMVLRCINSGGPTNQRQVTPSARKKHSSKLMVSFYSDAVLDLLSLPSDIAQADVFHLLAETAHSPSVTKTFKTQVRESIDQGESISVGIMLEKTRKRRASTGVANKRPTIFDLQSVRGDEERRQTKNSKYDRFWTHWTPLKDVQGNIDWVVLIINAAA